MNKKAFKNKKAWLMIAALLFTLLNVFGAQLDPTTYNNIVNQVVEILDVFDVLE